MKIRCWKIAYWILFSSWIIGAALIMARIKGGFLTNYLSDLTFPAWFYIYIRGLTKVNQKPQLLFFKDWFGASPERALVSILFIGIITELKTLFWPMGIISGTFDFLDILVYTVGLLVCYYLDKRNCNI